MGIPVAVPVGTATDAQRRRVARLFHRAGFGATVDDIDRWAAQGYEATVEHLLSFPPAATRADEAEAAALEGGAPVNRIERFDMSTFVRWWLDRMATTQYPLEEKLTLAWHDHFATAFGKVLRPRLMLRQNRLLRHHAGGNFRELANAITADAAMLFWLDGNTNQAATLNENYGREFMELFTLGTGHYTQNDVREASRAFTGYTVDQQGNVAFRPALHDAGEKTVLGHTGPWGPADMTDIVLDRHPDGPVAARYVARRLAAFLHHPDPEPEVVTAMADAFAASGFQIREMVRALLLRPEFTDGEAQTVKPPAELVAGTIRALRLARIPFGGEGRGRARRADGFAEASADMGQDLFDPPSVAGWKGGAGWANTATMLARYNFAARVAKQVSENAVRAALATAGGEPRETTGPWMRSLGLLELLRSTGASIDRYLAESAGAGTDATTRTRGVLTLLLASPDYNLR